MRVLLTGRVHLRGEDEAKSAGERSVPERSPEGRGWRGLAGWMKAQIRRKTRNRGRGWVIFHRPDEKIARRGPVRADEWR
jgi:hypothetical protein